MLWLSFTLVYIIALFPFAIIYTLENETTQDDASSSQTR